MAIVLCIVRTRVVGVVRPCLAVAVPSVRPHKRQRVPRELAQTEPRRLPEREPAACVGRAVDLVAQLAADDPHAVDDADRVHPAGRHPDPSTTSVLDVGQPDDLALVAGFLGELAQDRDLGRLTELETASRQRPDLSGPDRRGDLAEQDPSALVGGTERMRRRVSARGSWREQRREEARIERAAGGDEVTHDEAHRRTNGRASGDPSSGVFEQRRVGRGTPGRATTRRLSRGTDAASPGRRRRSAPARPRSCARDRGAASSAETRPGGALRR